VEFLSDDWFRAANDALAGLETDLDDALVIEHVIEHNGATVPYQLVIEARGCALEKGRPRSAHVTMAQSQRQLPPCGRALSTPCRRCRTGGSASMETRAA